MGQFANKEIFAICEISAKGGVAVLDYPSNDKMNIINYPLIIAWSSGEDKGIFLIMNCMWLLTNIDKDRRQNKV